MALEITEDLAWTKALTEADTKAKLIDLTLHAHRWTEDTVKYGYNGRTIFQSPNR